MKHPKESGALIRSGRNPPGRNLVVTGDYFLDDRAELQPHRFGFYTDTLQQLLRELAYVAPSL